LFQFKSTPAEDITKNFKYSIESFAWSPDGDKIFFLATINATRQIFVYDIKSKKISQLTEGVHDYNAIVPYKKGKDVMLIGLKSSMSSPAALYKIDMKGNESPLENINDGLMKSISWGTVKKRMVTTTDNKQMLTWVIYPPNFDSTKKYSTLLYCQGGPQSPVSQFFSYRWNFQLMAAQGYIVVAPNRRGLPGFGQEWTDAIKNDYGGQPMRDYLSAIDDVAKEPYVNKDKLGAVGASYGGYSVYYLAGMHNKRFKCFISHCGMFNMESWFGSTEEMFFAKNDNGYYWENTENYQKNSPHKFVKNWDAPILVIHNEKDFRVPLSEGMQAFTAAQSLGIPSRFLYFPDEGHWVNKPQNSLLWNRVFFEWLGMWLKE
jgi:dipeptidyl aminopeptidase/acylaminoacyl peptidase